MKKFVIPITLLFLGLVIIILKSKDNTDLMNEPIIALLCLIGIIVFLISLGFNIKFYTQKKEKFDYLLVISFLIISFAIWAYNNDLFKSKITLHATSLGYYGFVEELALRENNHYEFISTDFKHYYKKHGEYKMIHDSILLNNSGYFDQDMFYFRYSKYLLNHTNNTLIPVLNGKLLMDSSKMLRIEKIHNTN